MDTAVIRAVNKLWFPVYPGIARQIAEYCTRQPGRILEAGCFSGGIGLMLLKQFPGSTLTIAPEIEELAATFSSDWADCLSDRPQIACGLCRVRWHRWAERKIHLTWSFAAGCSFSWMPEAHCWRKLFRFACSRRFGFCRRRIRLLHIS